MHLKWTHLRKGHVQGTEVPRAWRFVREGQARTQQTLKGHSAALKETVVGSDVF